MNTHFTLFYADDDLEDLELFREITGAIGDNIELHTHSRGEQLLAALQNPPPSPHIIFLDINMPEKNGFDVLSELRLTENFKEIPVVMFSTSSDEKNIAKSLDLGANFYLPKSTDYRSFKRSIEHTLSINWKTFKPSINDFIYTNVNT